MARRVELFSGLAAALLGSLGVVYALFGPTGSYASEEVRSDGTKVVTSGSTSMWENEDFAPITILFFLVMLANMLGVALGAWLHARRGADAGLVLLWMSTAVLLGGTILSLLSVGLFFMPAALLALVAAISGSISMLDHDRDDHPRSAM